MPKILSDDDIKNALDELFGLLDDPDISEDEYEQEPDNLDTYEGMTLYDILSGANVTDSTQEKNDSNLEESFNQPSTSGLHLDSRNNESTQVKHDSDDERETSIHSSTSGLHLDRRRNRLLDSPPEPPFSQLPTAVDTISETDDSDGAEDQWKKVIWSQQPNVDDFDRVRLQGTQFLSSQTRPTTYFTRFFDDDIFTHIVTQTNLYAEQNQSRNWTPVCCDEIKAFIGIIILMGLHPLTTVDLFWASDPFFRVDEIASIMPIKRFKKILENLHLNNNEQTPQRATTNFDKLFKVRPILDLLNIACQREAKTTSSQSIDESMIRFKGRSTLKQYMSFKPIKRGYKVWVRADSKTGYVYEFSIYTGKREDQAPEVGLGVKVVKTLTQKLIDQGFRGHVAFDNFFASYELLQYLFENGIYATATVNSGRSDLPLIL
ncbi:unnamed protein product [Parnassius apollo]|uniref:(apollo) hypothetical protein n=1 Tax=Parnassius apollo TaxID=110799 RepID=A0A8S3Y322_PARAO|nr:unnamed protein product [Parnassius apollo]